MGKFFNIHVGLPIYPKHTPYKILYPIFGRSLRGLQLIGYEQTEEDGFRAVHRIKQGGKPSINDQFIWKGSY